MATNQGPTAAALALINQYRPGFYVAANEEAVVTDQFTDATEGSVRLGNVLYLRKIDAFPASQVVEISTDAGASWLTFRTNTGPAPTVTPKYYYIGMQL